MMDITNIIRVLDIILIGPGNILFAFTLWDEQWLFWPVLSIGVLTVFYNYINFNRMYRHKSDPKLFGLLPENFRNLFWDPINGKTQLLRATNLLIMYPLLIYAALHANIGNSTILQYSTYITLFFIVTGILYNLYYFVIIQWESTNENSVIKRDKLTPHC